MTDQNNYQCQPSVLRSRSARERHLAAKLPSLSTPLLLNCFSKMLQRSGLPWKPRSFAARSASAGSAVGYSSTACTRCIVGRAWSALVKAKLLGTLSPWH